MRAAIHQLHYWPGLRFLSKMRVSDVFVYLDDVQFEKREFQNRNRIRTPGGWQYLTVPVLSKGRFLQTIREVETDNSLPWREDHLRALITNYGRAKYFKEYRPALESLYSRRYDRLAELAVATIEFLRGAFGISSPVRFSSEFGLESVSTKRIVDLCKAVDADEYHSGEGGRHYLDPVSFSECGIELTWQEFTTRPYPQVFEGFVPDMSGLDLLLNCGPESVKYL